MRLHEIGIHFYCLLAVSFSFLKLSKFLEDDAEVVMSFDEIRVQFYRTLKLDSHSANLPSDFRVMPKL